MALEFLRSHFAEERGQAIMLTRDAIADVVWYAIPFKMLAPPQELHELVAAIAAILDALGPRAGPLAEIARAPVTSEIIELASSRSETRARKLATRALDSLGTTEVDVPGLGWGRFCGSAEIEASESVRLALDVALDDGRLKVGSRAGAGRRIREDITASVLDTRPPRSRKTHRELIRIERRAEWHRRDGLRASVFGHVVEASIDARLDDVDAEYATVGIRKLLAAGVEGHRLTQTGAIGQTLAREIVAACPDWWGPVGQVRTSLEVRCLQSAAELLQAAKLIRFGKTELKATPAGRTILPEPDRLLAVMLDAVVNADPATADAMTGVVAVLLQRPEATYEQMESAVVEIITAGYEIRVAPQHQRMAMSHLVGDAIGGMRVFRALSTEYRRWPERDRYSLTEDGRRIALTFIDTCATGPRTRL